jgi:dihydrofolate reductase
MIISCIVAVDNNYAIGKGNDIPWYLPADLKYFKKNTINKTILMGRKCFQSIGRPLPKRNNVVVTRDPYYIVSNCIVVRSIEEGIQWSVDNGDEELCIIGGGTIYEQTQDLWDKLYLTEVDLAVEEPEIFFPKVDLDNWKLVSEESHTRDEKNLHDYTFKQYIRS